MNEKGKSGGKIAEKFKEMEGTSKRRKWDSEVIIKNWNNDFIDSIGNEEFEDQKINKVTRLEQVKIGKIFGMLKIIFRHQIDCSLVCRL